MNRFYKAIWFMYGWKYTISCIAIAIFLVWLMYQ